MLAKIGKIVSQWCDVYSAVPRCKITLFTYFWVMVTLAVLKFGFGFHFEEPQTRW